MAAETAGGGSGRAWEQDRLLVMATVDVRMLERSIRATASNGCAKGPARSKMMGMGGRITVSRRMRER